METYNSEDSDTNGEFIKDDVAVGEIEETGLTVNEALNELADNGEWLEYANFLKELIQKHEEPVGATNRLLDGLGKLASTDKWSDYSKCLNILFGIYKDNKEIEADPYTYIDEISVTYAKHEEWNNYASLIIALHEANDELPFSFAAGELPNDVTINIRNCLKYLKDNDLETFNKVSDIAKKGDIEI